MPSQYEVAQYLQWQGIPATPQNMQIASQYLYNNPTAMQQNKLNMQRSGSEIGGMVPDGMSIEDMVNQTVGGTQNGQAGTPQAQGQFNQPTQNGVAGLQGSPNQQQAGNAGTEKQADGSTQTAPNPKIEADPRPSPAEVEAEPSIEDIVTDETYNGVDPRDLIGQTLAGDQSWLAALGAIASAQGVRSARDAANAPTPDQPNAPPGGDAANSNNPGAEPPGGRGDIQWNDVSPDPRDMTPEEMAAMQSGANNENIAPTRKQAANATANTQPWDGQNFETIKRAFSDAGVDVKVLPGKNGRGVGQLQVTAPDGQILTFWPSQLNDAAFLDQFFRTLGAETMTKLTRAFERLAGGLRGGL